MKSHESVNKSSGHPHIGCSERDVDDGVQSLDGGIQSSGAHG